MQLKQKQKLSVCFPLGSNVHHHVRVLCHVRVLWRGRGRGRWHEDHPTRVQIQIQIQIPKQYPLFADLHLYVDSLVVQEE
jgi:hypothetical protein